MVERMSVHPRDNDSANADAPARIFRSPSGREWAARIYEVPAGFGVRTDSGEVVTGTILRFRSGDLTLDLSVVPCDWASRSEEDLVDLLRSATVPAFVPLGSADAQLPSAPTGGRVRPVTMPVR
jgi:hypothetical protein